MASAASTPSPPPDPPRRVQASFDEQHTVGAECERAELRPRPQDKTELEEVLQTEEEAEIRP